MKHRPHTPWKIGPRLFRRGRYWWIDLRYMAGGRCVMRDPTHPAWPDAGERTELYEVADRWKWAYVDLGHRLHKERVLGVSRVMALTEAVREYTEARRPLVSRSTQGNDKAALAQLVKDFGSTPVHLVDPQRTLNRLLSEGYEPYTVEIYSAFLSGFWRWLGLPYAIELPRYQRAEPRVWTNDEIETIRDKAGDLLTAIDAGLYMGLRFGEIFGLEWSDVDLATWTVRVRRQKGGAPLKSRRARTAVILPGWTHPHGSGTVAVPAKRQRLTTVLKRAELLGDGVGWHSFRHTYARLFLEAKPDMRLLQASLGHGSVTTTEQAYNWLLPDKAAEMSVRAIHGR